LLTFTGGSRNSSNTPLAWADFHLLFLVGDCAEFLSQ
jgi:hypothetical protein